MGKSATGLKFLVTKAEDKLREILEIFNFDEDSIIKVEAMPDEGKKILEDCLEKLAVFRDVYTVDVLEAIKNLARLVGSAFNGDYSADEES